MPARIITTNIQNQYIQSIGFKTNIINFCLNDSKCCPKGFSLWILKLGCGKFFVISASLILVEQLPKILKLIYRNTFKFSFSRFAHRANITGCSIFKRNTFGGFVENGPTIFAAMKGLWGRIYFWYR